LLENQNSNESNASLQVLLKQAEIDLEGLDEVRKQELMDKDNALSSSKDFYEKYAEELDQEIVLLKSKIQDLECDLISARSDRDNFASQHPEIAEISLADISALHIGFVGGKSRTIKEVITRLESKHGLVNYVVLAGGHDENQNMNQNTFREKLKSCNLIVLITVCVGHPYSSMLKNLQGKGSITKNSLYINLRGESGIVREVVNHGSNLDIRDSE